MYNVEEMKKLYPEMFSPTAPTDLIIGVLIISSLFIVPYLYIRFLEDRVIAFLGNRLLLFIEFRLRLKKDSSIFKNINDNKDNCNQP